LAAAIQMMKDRDRIADDACNWIEIPKYPDGHSEADMATGYSSAVRRSRRCLLERT
jgi:hypothetical protein